MKKIAIGIVAHVDAGKTTLSEAMLYTAGMLRQLGRVDKKNSFLDTYELERAKGITIFSKQAVFQMGKIEFILLDTPGHVDFSSEMERTVKVLDYAILVVSGSDGVQAHTRTLWDLLERYQIPVFLFINKMDQPGIERKLRMEELQKRLYINCVDFMEEGESFFENIAVCDELLLEKYLETGIIRKKEIQLLIKNRKLFPIFFGSALKLEGVKEFMQGMSDYMLPPYYPVEFSGKVFKIARDEQGNRMTFLKVTGGSLSVRSLLPETEEKISQIRIYSGEKYNIVQEVSAGDICALLGPVKTKIGDVFGKEEVFQTSLLTPVLHYRLILPDGCEASLLLPKLRQLEEEDPELKISWSEALQEIQIQIMGEVQIEIIKSLIKTRFDVEVEFDQGNIVYRETIKNIVEGIGHFEPLRHYSEVHFLLEPGKRGSGLVVASELSEDELNRNWQHLILSHLLEKEHKGVLIGAAITDLKITLVAGRAHKKHTEGGDFRQATYRGVRQGLMQAESLLLEPFYTFRMEVPEENIGRTMADIDKMHGVFEAPQFFMNRAILTGSAPVATMRGYYRELAAYTKGLGKLSCSFLGYDLCHNQEKIIQQYDYHPESDIDNSPDSIFCSHGAGFLVKWDQVKDYMHLESCLQKYRSETEEFLVEDKKKVPEWIAPEEVEAILLRASFANKQDRDEWKKMMVSKKKAMYEEELRRISAMSQKRNLSSREAYLLVDGYNIIFSWEELKELAAVSIDGARGRLLDILCNYQGFRGCQVIVVFDAYRLSRQEVSILDYLNIHVVFTKMAETADQYIEKFAQKHAQTFDITVATSDYMEQIITRGQGCKLLSARELLEEVEQAEEWIRHKLQS